ncbi:hypothetical protein A9Q74_06325 [Colwellia sp. 39_35_sub15_T18]|nr:hypothetical protein A9Q74_06325 [Colwellia sp. 39_35_sub15_T18]
MSDLKLAIKLTTDGGKIVVKDLQQIDDAADKVNHSLTGTGKSGRVAGQGLNQASGGADVLTGSLKSMLAQAAGVIALGFGIDKIASGMYDGIDAFQGYRGQLKTITGDFDSASVELDRLINLSKETPFTLAQSVEGFSKLTHLGLDPSKQSMISYGNTAAAMGKDLMQMIEAVADASVGEFERLKEFGIKASSQGENVRFTFQNVSTTIKKDAASIQQYLIDLGNNKFGDAMGDQMGRLSAKSSNLQTSIAQLYNEMGNLGAADSIGNSIDGIASLIDEITKNLPEVLENITTLFEVMAVVVGAKLLPAYTSLVANGIKTYIASNIAASVSTNAMGQVISRTTVKMNLMAAAGRAAKGSLALIGGPIGVAVLAGYALYELNDAMGETRTGAEQLEETLGKTRKAIEDMTRAEQLSTQAAYKKLINEKKAAIDELKALAKEQAQQANNTNGKNSSTASGVQLWGTSEQAKTATKELEALKNSLSDVEGALFDAGMAGIQWNKVIVKGVDLAKAKAEAAKKSANNEKIKLTTNQKLIASLKQQLKISKLTGIEKLEEINLSKLSSEIKDGEIAKVKELTAALYEQSQIAEQKQDDSDYYQSVIDGANDISESWNAAGNVIVNTFGTIGEQLDKLAQQQESYANKQRKLAADKVKYADDPKKLGEISKAENALAKQKDRNAISEISSYRAITDSAASMFSENSKGRKAMQAASDVFTAIELANSALRVGSYAIEAVTAAFAAPWPIGFASGAAMIAIMAGLGVAVSGGSGSAPESAEQRQQTQGTGTVLGSDDKSASILNSYERIEELELDQYAELREMNASLNDLNNNITNLVANLVSNFGRFDEASYGGQLGNQSTTSKFEELLIGGGIGQVLKSLDPTGIVGKIFSSFSSKKKSLVDSGISIVAQTFGDVIDTGLLQAQAYFDIKTKKKKFWGISSSTSYNTEYQSIGSQLEHEMALIFGDIGNSINQAVDVLDLDVSKSLDDFVIDLPKISFKDLSGDEIQAELEAMFSSQSDLMATYLVPGLQDFQQVGEGLYETLIRLAQEQAVFNSVLEITGNTLADVDANQTIEATQAIIGFAGSIEALQSAASTYFNEFYSEAEQFDYLQKQLNEQFAALGLSVPATRDGFKTLISVLDPLNEADQRLYAQLLLLSGQSAEYYDALENQGTAIDDTLEKENELAAARQAFVEDIQGQLERLDMSPLQIKLDDLQKTFLDSFEDAQQLGAETALLEQLYANRRQTIVEDALENVNAVHQRSMDTLTRDHEEVVNDLVNNNTRLVSAFSALNASIANSILSIRRQGSNWSESNYQTTQISDLSSLLGEGSVEEQISNIDSLQQAYVNKYNAELQGLNASRDAAQSAYDNQLNQIENRYQAELEVYNGMRSALDSLKDAVDNLLLSDLSTLTNEQKLAESKSQYQTTLARAKTGDVDAISSLGNVHRNYLSEAQNMYSSSDAFQNIFDKSFAEVSAISAKNIHSPSKQRAPSVPAAITRHNVKVQELQTSTVESLQELHELSKALEAENQTAFDIAMSDLTLQLDTNKTLLIAELSANTLEINTQAAADAQTLNEAMQRQLEARAQQNAAVQQNNEKQTDATNKMREQVVAELRSVKAELNAQTKKQNQQILQAQQQAADAQKRAEKLARQLKEQATIIENQSDAFMRALP